MSKQKPTLGYWNIRGRANFIKLVLEYLDVDYNFEGYDLEAGPTKSKWFEKKPKMPLDFPNLPYYIDGDLKFTESSAIVKYIARKHGLVPDDTCNGWAIAEMLEGNIHELLVSFGTLCYNPNFEKEKANYLDVILPGQLKPLEAYLVKHDSKWLTGNKISYVDFQFGEILNYLYCLEKNFCKDLPKISKFMKEFEDLSAVKKHRKNNPYFPILATMAAWGGKAEERKECTQF